MAAVISPMQPPLPPVHHPATSTTVTPSMGSLTSRHLRPPPQRVDSDATSDSSLGRKPAHPTRKSKSQLFSPTSALDLPTALDLPPTHLASSTASSIVSTVNSNAWKLEFRGVVKLVRWVSGKREGRQVDSEPQSHLSSSPSFHRRSRRLSLVDALELTTNPIGPHPTLRRSNEYSNSSPSEATKVQHHNNDDIDDTRDQTAKLVGSIPPGTQRWVLNSHDSYTELTFSIFSVSLSPRLVVKVWEALLRIGTIPITHPYRSIQVPLGMVIGSVLTAKIGSQIQPTK